MAYNGLWINCRRGSRFGHDVVIDGMLKDGLWDVYNDFHMGMCAELCADQHSISREEQVASASNLYESKFVYHQNCTSSYLESNKYFDMTFSFV
jgi:hypothetical protein